MRLAEIVIEQRREQMVQPVILQAERRPQRRQERRRGTFTVSSN